MRTALELESIVVKDLISNKGFDKAFIEHKKGHDVVGILNNVTYLFQVKGLFGHASQSEITLLKNPNGRFAMVNERNEVVYKAKTDLKCLKQIPPRYFIIWK